MMLMVDNMKMIAIAQQMINCSFYSAEVFSIALPGRGASTVKIPSLESEDRISSGFVPVGSKNSLLYSL